MKSKKRYLILLVLLLVAVPVSVLLINLVVDPHGRVLMVNKAGFNRDKLTIKPQSRKAKAAIVRECERDIVILGSTRAEGSVNPGSPAFSGQSVYNAAMKGSSMLEAEKIGLYMLGFQQPDQVFLDLGFYMFSDLRGTAHDFNESPLADKQSLVSILGYLLSPQAFRQSYYTVKFNRAGMSMCDQTGYGIGFPVRGAPLDRIAKRIDSYVSTASIYGDYKPGDIHYESLETLLSALTAAGVKVHVYMSPVHALQLESIRQLGLMDDYESWKRRVVQITGQINETLNDDQQMTLWDFSGYNNVSMETVPVSGAQQMQWFKDSAANTPAVGEMIAGFLLDAEGRGAEFSPGFGVALNITNIDQFLIQQRQAGDSYAQSGGDEIRLIKEIVAGEYVH